MTSPLIPLLATLLLALCPAFGGPAFSKFVNPNSNVSNGSFGQSVTLLSTGNVVITDPTVDLGGEARGAVYLFNGATGALISTLRGAADYDQIGSGGVKALTNGNFVVISPAFDGYRAAATWGSGTLGVSGVVSAANSLLNSVPYAVDLEVFPLTNGNYVVTNDEWKNGSLGAAGSVTWGNGTIGVKGVISTSNSLTGSDLLHQVGLEITPLTNGNFVVYSRLQGDRGASTWVDGTTGLIGTVSAANSLVGSNSGDQVGEEITPLPNGSYLIRSANWDNGSATNAGAVTWASGTSGITGTISASNSLIGSTADDFVGYQDPHILANGNYLVPSMWWHGSGGAVHTGAVTWGSNTSGVTGMVSAANSLVGTAAYDGIAEKPLIELPSGDYLVQSPDWNNGAVVDAGAVTWGSGSSGVKGVVSAANSLVGTLHEDKVGHDGPENKGVTVLSNGNYVVCSRYWKAKSGAVTWANGTTGLVGAVSTANSLTGEVETYWVGTDGVVALTNGNYVVCSGLWGPGGEGAATWCNGMTGTTGLVSSANSLVGRGGADFVGSQGAVALANGNYVVISPSWDDGIFPGPEYLGAVTWGNGSTGTTGPVTPANSMTGSQHNDMIGYDGVVALPGGNYVIRTSFCRNGAVINAGAVTWCSGSGPTSAVLSPANSLMGSTADDRVGQQEISILSNGNYLVFTPEWDAGAVTNVGAVTWCSQATGKSGVISSANSLVGSTTGDRVGGTGYGHITLANGNYVVRSFAWDNGAITDAGAVTWGNGTTGATGAVSALNSLVGTTVNEGLGLEVSNDAYTPSTPGLLALPGGNYLVRNSLSAPTAAERWKRVAWGDGSTGLTGSLNIGNCVTSAAQGMNLREAIIDAPQGNFIIPITKDYTSSANAVIVGSLADGFGPPGAVQSDADIEQPPGTPRSPGTGTVAFGTLVTGQESTLTFALVNRGGLPLTSISGSLSGTGAAAYTILSLPSSVPARNVAYFTVKFTSTTAGSKPATLRITSSDPNESPYDISLTGTVVAPAPEIAVEKDGANVADGGSAGFGLVSLGGSSDITFTIRNSGNADLVLSGSPRVAVTGTNAAQFVVTSMPASPVVPGGSTTFTVRFTPTSSGPKSAALSIPNNDANEGPYDIPLTGTGAVLTGDALDYTAVTWTTGGDASWAGQTSIHHDGQDAAASGTISHGQESWMQATFTEPGTLSFWWKVSSEENYDYLSVLVNGSELEKISGEKAWEKKTIVLGAGNNTIRWRYYKDATSSAGSDKGWVDQVELVPQAAEMAVDQAGANLADGGAFDFGPMMTGQGRNVDFTIRNSGSSALLLTGTPVVSITGTDASSFTVVAPPASTSVSGLGGSTPFTVRFTPGSTGAKTATLSIQNNDPDENPFDIILTGTGTPFVSLGNALDYTAATWTTGGTTPWTEQTAVHHDGQDAAVSGTIPHLQESWMEATFDGPGTLSFWWKVSSEENYDYLSILVNGGELDKISGEKAWVKKTIVLGDGNNTVRWRYYKDRSANNGSDKGWVDQVEFLSLGAEIAIDQNGIDLADGGNFNFGSAVAGQAKDLVFFIRNPGSSALQLTGSPTVAIAGTDASSFAVIAHPAATSVSASGGTTQFTVRFSPGSSGAKTATLSLPNNDPNEGPFDLTLTGTGITAADAFATAMTQAGLTGNDALATAEPRHDGISNLLKYAFNIDPSLPSVVPRTLVPATGTSGLPAIQLIGTGPDGTIRIEYLRRKGSGLIYTPQVSDTLALALFQPTTAVPQVTSINATWERVIVSEPVNLTTAPRRFVTVKVEFP
ncbi:choice-of-anchor D domain-containing protein [Luteolibacter arcticus]|uniref:Choice-of-anchor D domain-containing protein n=1 Tax=Luteolibacter arcticus TaxID=1581411 RepID=A0ABT3GGN4_9BACT|nr:choice-of-anchor D domain-containing protein [Luteolibacter arcticus]MCW1922766.1 choice-of-anchor D domain-containing protein [Luteolibacter arcticus]